MQAAAAIDVPSFLLWNRRILLLLALPILNLGARTGEPKPRLASLTTYQQFLAEMIVKEGWSQGVVFLDVNDKLPVIGALHWMNLGTGFPETAGRKGTFTVGLMEQYTTTLTRCNLQFAANGSFPVITPFERWNLVPGETKCDPSFSC